MISVIDSFDLSKNAPLDQRTVVADATARLALTWVYKGLITYQVDTDTIYKYTGTPPSNLSGDWTTVLNTGAAGAPGSVWYNGSGVPGSGLGIVGDYYLDTASGNVYNKTGISTWSLITNIKGPTGASGTASGDYASIAITGGVTAQNLTTTPAKLINFTANGSSTGSTPDYVNNKITVTNPGDYILYFSMDGTFTVNHIWTFVIYANGVATSVLGTVNSASDTTTRVNFQQAINIPAASTVIELYGSVDAGTNAVTMRTAILGVVGVNSKGATGNTGAALIHTEHDLGVAPNANFDAAKIAAVQAGTWTPIAPWSASIFLDGRADKSTPSALLGDKTGHSVSWNGTAWTDNGVWRGPTGPIGLTGPTGASGAAGPAGLIPFYEMALGTVQNLSTGWYHYDLIVSNPIVFGGGNTAGVVVTITRSISIGSGVDIAVPPDSTFASATITCNANASFVYKGRYVTTIPMTSRSITFIMVRSQGGVDYWKVVGEDEAGVTSVNGFKGDVTLDLSGTIYTPAQPANFNPTNDLRSSGTAVASFATSSFTFTATVHTRPLIQFTYHAYRPSVIGGGHDCDITSTIQASPDNVSWSALKSQTLRIQEGLQIWSVLAAVDNSFITAGSTWYYRLLMSPGFTCVMNADYLCYAVLN